MSEQYSRRRLSVAEGHRLRINLGRVAILAAGLGLLMEALLVLGGAAAATFSSLLDKGLWPFLVCLAVAVGQALSGGAPLRAGAFAVFLTPVAFLFAKVSQKGVVTVLDGTAPGEFVTQALLLEAGLRAVEYAVLTAALAWLARQVWAGALAYLGAGAGVGLLFGLLIAAILPPATLVGWVVAELVFPTGCALILFVSETMTQLLPDEATPGAVS
jgi:hypothetical protein